MTIIEEEREERDYNYLFKTFFVGDSGVGKSSLLLQFVEENFSEKVSTIGLDFRIKKYKCEEDGEITKLQLLDTAGQERFRTISSSCYRGVHGILLVYDTTNRHSFENLKSWIIEIERFAAESVVIVIVGNKADLTEKKKVASHEGEEFARNHNLPFFEVSAKNNEDVVHTFGELIKLMKVKFPNCSTNQQQQQQGDSKCGCVYKDDEQMCNVCVTSALRSATPSPFSSFILRKDIFQFEKLNISSKSCNC